MQELKYKFKAKELEEKGFQLTTDDSEIYFQFLDNPEDWFGSKFIATQSVDAVDWLSDFKNDIDFTVIKPTGEEIGEPYMTEQEIDEYIKQARNAE